MKLLKLSNQTCQENQVKSWLYIHYAPLVGAFFVIAIGVRYDKGILYFFYETIVL